MLLTDKEENQWVDLGGYETDEDGNIVFYWCIPVGDVPHYEAEFSTFTKVLAKDLI